MSTPDTTHHCCRCRCEIQPTETEIRNRKLICKPCVRIRHKEYRQGRVVAGLKSQKRYPKTVAKIMADKRYWASDKGRAARRSEYQRARLDPAWQQRAHARRVTRWALDSGKIKREPCQACGNPKSEAHHPDYNLPREVLWLCRRHHIQAHGKRNIIT